MKKMAAVKADAKAKGEEVRNIGHRSGMKDENRRSLSSEGEPRSMFGKEARLRI